MRAAVDAPRERASGPGGEPVAPPRHGGAPPSWSLGGFLDSNWWNARRMRAVAWRGLAVVTCPCCIPIWLAILSGTAVGALLSRNLVATVVLFLVLFSFVFWKALRSYDSQSAPSTRNEAPEGR